MHLPKHYGFTLLSWLVCRLIARASATAHINVPLIIQVKARSFLPQLQDFTDHFPPSYFSIMSAEEFVKKSYDYVIIGGGTAGLVLAVRLTEDSNVTVGVLELGGNRLNDPLIDAPNLYIQTWDNPEYDWCYKTVPQVENTPKTHCWQAHSSSGRYAQPSAWLGTW